MPSRAVASLLAALSLLPLRALPEDRPAAPAAERSTAAGAEHPAAPSIATDEESRRALVAVEMLRTGEIDATFRPLADVALTAGVQHVGERYLDQENTYLLDSYVLVDASASWSPGPVRLTVSAHNLLDERYYQGGDTSTAASVEVGTPRQLIMAVGFTHGQ